MGRRRRESLDLGQFLASAGQAPTCSCTSVGRRPDGYHLLQTVFRFIDRADTLHFAPRADGDVVLATPAQGVEAANDLTFRAARLLQEGPAVATAPRST